LYSLIIQTLQIPAIPLGSRSFPAKKRDERKPPMAVILLPAAVSRTDLSEREAQTTPFRRRGSIPGLAPPGWLCKRGRGLGAPVAGRPPEDIAVEKDGLVVSIWRSKTDQEGQGRKVALPYGSNPETCPVRAYQQWLEGRAETRGGIPADRPSWEGGHRIPATKDSVGLIVKRAAARIGLAVAQYAGHSLRAGLATQAYLNGANELSIMQRTGHRSLATTVRKYIRESSLFRDNPAAKLGL
jgi:hypothetical protein